MYISKINTYAWHVQKHCSGLLVYPVFVEIQFRLINFPKSPIATAHGRLLVKPGGGLPDLVSMGILAVEKQLFFSLKFAVCLWKPGLWRIFLWFWQHVLLSFCDSVILWRCCTKSFQNMFDVLLFVEDKHTIPLYFRKRILHVIPTSFTKSSRGQWDVECGRFMVQHLMPNLKPSKIYE